MHRTDMHSHGHQSVPENPAERLQAEIAALQQRLDNMGMDGDCAYERALSRVYAGLVKTRKRQLAELLQGVTA